MPIAFSLTDDVPADAAAVGAPVFAGRILPPGSAADLDLNFLAERGFEGKPGEALAVPAGRGTWIALGVGVEHLDGLARERLDDIRGALRRA